MGHLIKQRLCFIQEIEFDVDVEEDVNQERFGLVTSGEKVLVDEPGLVDGTSGQTALEEFGISDRDCPYIAVLHGI